MVDVWKYILKMQDVYQNPVLKTKEADVVCICKAKVELAGRRSTLQGGEDYQTVSKLYLASREMDKQFNEDR